MSISFGELKQLVLFHAPQGKCKVLPGFHPSANFLDHSNPPGGSWGGTVISAQQRNLINMLEPLWLMATCYLTTALASFGCAGTEQLRLRQ